MVATSPQHAPSTRGGADANGRAERGIVVGGRGVGGPAGFDALRSLARWLGTDWGATRAAVDAGWAPAARLVGASGAWPPAERCLLVGSSAALQLRAGLPGVRWLAAVDHDPASDALAVADLPLLTDAPGFLAAATGRRTRARTVVPTAGPARMPWAPPVVPPSGPERLRLLLGGAPRRRVSPTPLDATTAADLFLAHWAGDGTGQHRNGDGTGRRAAPSRPASGEPA